MPRSFRLSATKLRQCSEAPALSDFAPDQLTLELLQSEHVQFQWIGPRLLHIANRIRSSGGSRDDYQRWVTSSHLWMSYQGSTRDSIADQGRHLESAWRKSADSKPFELDDALADLEDRVRSARWTGRAGSRNRAVALAFIGFCRDRNCFTRSISSYELAKHTAGMSQKPVHNALRALVELGLLARIERSDRRSSSRSANRYQINLYWKPPLGMRPRVVDCGPTPVDHSGDPLPDPVSDLRSTCKYSLSSLRDPNRDLWSSKGLGQTPGRVYDALADEPATVRELSDRAGLGVEATRRAARKLADHCLAGERPGKPVRYFKVETPLHAVEHAIGCAGYVERAIEKLNRRQEANRQGYPSNYTNELRGPQIA